MIIFMAKANCDGTLEDGSECLTGQMFGSNMTQADARTAARDEGWTVGPAPKGMKDRRPRTYCPDCTARRRSAAAAKANKTRRSM